MSLANEMLNGMNPDEVSTYSVDPTTEEHIVIGADRRITVPAALKRIAVQYDHNVETVTFDCPRYWDGLDMSVMVVYINYRLPNGDLGSYIADNVVVDDTDETVMHFNWTISKNVTIHKGNMTFLVCIKKNDANGVEENHWNSELNNELYISEGLACSGTVIVEYPDIITQLLTQMDAVTELVGNIDTLLDDINGEVV